MILILAAVQFALCAAFAALSRWMEAAGFAALGGFFLVAFFGIPDRAAKPVPHEGIPDAKHDPLTAGDVAYMAKSGSYWLSSAFFYASLFGMAYGAAKYVPDLPVRTLLGGVLSAVSLVLLALYAASWKKGIPQIALVFRINALLLSGISAGSLLYASVRPAATVPWVFWSHAGLSAAAMAVTLFSDRFADPRFLRFLVGWSAGFVWALCTYLVSLAWSGWEPVTLTAAVFGLVVFWLPNYVRLPFGWPSVAKLSGAGLTLAANVSAVAALWWLPMFPTVLPTALALAVFHGWLHRQYRNWIAFSVAVAAFCACYVSAVAGVWGSHGFAVLVLCAAGLPALSVLVTYLARLRAVDAWFAQYAAISVMAGYAYAGSGRGGYSTFEWSVLLMAASLAWYGAWTLTARKA